MTSPACVAVDWGTSRMRLWALDKDGSILAERRSDEGLEGVRATGFSQTLESHLHAHEIAADVPVIICGMAGSRQGWIEAPYAPVPTGLNDLPSLAVKAPDIRRDVRILPGICEAAPDKADVMRGEETQLAGLGLGKGRHLVAMPGTHSKWVLVDDGVVTHFSTYVTGELFAQLSQHSILRHSVTGAGIFGPDHPQFVSAARQMTEQPAGLSGALFSVRANSLVHGADATASAARLSGLLIGAEIGAARLAAGDAQVVLVGAGALGKLYEAALALAGMRFTATDGEALSRAGLYAAAKALWPARFN